MKQLSVNKLNSLSLKKNNGELMKLTNNAIKRFAKGQLFTERL